jgi:hypothetical protein
MMKTNSKSVAIAMTIASFSVIATGCGSGAPIAVPAQFAAPIAVNPINAGLIGTGACVPLTQPIGFQGTGLTADNQSVYGGYIPYASMSPDPLVPSGGQYGRIVHSAGGVAGAMGGARTIMTQSGRPDGSIVMNVAEQGYLPTASWPMGYATGNGVITISPAKLSIIYGLFGLSYSNTSGMTGAYTQTGFPSGISFMPPGGVAGQSAPCVSGVAVSLSYASLVNNQIDGGRVYLYLNGQAHGVYLQF